MKYGFILILLIVLGLQLNPKMNQAETHCIEGLKERIHGLCIVIKQTSKKKKSWEFLSELIEKVESRVSNEKSVYKLKEEYHELKKLSKTYRSEDLSKNKKYVARVDTNSMLLKIHKECTNISNLYFTRNQHREKVEGEILNFSLEEINEVKFDIEVQGIFDTVRISGFQLKRFGCQK